MRRGTRPASLIIDLMSRPCVVCVPRLRTSAGLAPHLRMVLIAQTLEVQGVEKTRRDLYTKSSAIASDTLCIGICWPQGRYRALALILGP